MTRKLLPTVLEPFFTSFREALVDTHGKDMLAAPESAPASGASTPASTASAPAAAPAPAAAGGEKKAPALNTSEVSVAAELQVSAADLWDLLTNEQKVRPSCGLHLPGL